MSAEKLIAKSELCSGGGIGRRVWLRSIWCKPWGFKSPLEYHLFLYDVCAYIAQLVEHILGKDEVTSSTLVSSSKGLAFAGPFVFIKQKPSQQMRAWFCFSQVIISEIPYIRCRNLGCLPQRARCHRQVLRFRSGKECSSLKEYRRL